MHKKEKKILAGVLILAAMLIISVAVFASNEATQQASTSKVTTITIVGKVDDTAVATITFPEAAPSSTVSNPYNSVDGSGDPPNKNQVVAGSNSEPVVRLKNTSGGTLYVWLSITSWTNSIAASEDYELVATTTTDVSVVDDVLSSDGNANTVDTDISMDTGTYKALYLELNLSSVAGKTGTSTLSVLGES